MKKKGGKKQYLGLLCCVLVLVGFSGWAEAATDLTWDRNIESDMLQYRIYTCTVRGCTAVKGATPTATVPQTLVGVRPQWSLPTNTEGAAVVTAVDTSNNESGASVQAPFDTKAPAVPSGVQTQ